MLLRKNLFFIASIFSLLSLNSYAYKIDKPVFAKSVITSDSKNFEASKTPRLKTVSLMGVKLSAKEKKRFLVGLNPKTHQLHSTDTDSGLPESVALDMNDVPVFDQGLHPTSAIFATTGALDAIINRGDYVSELCSLELGSTLEQQTYLPSGWYGTEIFSTLHQLEIFGIVKKSDQMKKLCGGVSDYPSTDMNDFGSPISIEEFHLISHSISGILPDTYIQSHSILTYSERFKSSDEATFNQSMNTILNEVKSELASEDAKYTLRLPMSAFLPMTFCQDGACAKHNKENDTFVITDEIAGKLESGLEGAMQSMIITGYDDNATAVDSAGKVHTGLLILRNSWGTDTGDNGNFYMSYDFFRLFTIEVAEISSLIDD